MRTRLLFFLIAAILCAAGCSDESSGERTNSSFERAAESREFAAPSAQTALQSDPLNGENAQSGAPDEEITFWSDMPDGELASYITARMSDEEILAQILMFGWVGSSPSREILDWVEKRRLGGVKIFGWNTDDAELLADSVALLQRASQNSRFKIPLFVATDQEGGWVRHIKGKSSETPGNMAIGASGLPYDAWYSGYYIAMELRALGINMNFAPTVDLYTDVNSTVIGPRSFGDGARAAGILGTAFCAGQLAAGVIPTAKHFPGHGDTDVDSHGVLPIIEVDYQTLQERELVPFQMLIDAGVPAIMAGHLNFPLITGDSMPATLSEIFLNDILRENMRFSGLIITDDMMMNGATEAAGSLSSAVIQAIRAGVDVVLSSSTPYLNDALWTRTIALMKTDSDFREKAVRAAYRTIKTKLAYLKSPASVPLFPDKTAIDEQIPAPGSGEFFLEQACRSVTAIKPLSEALNAEQSETILLTGEFGAFIREGKKRFPNAQVFQLPSVFGGENVNQLRSAILRNAQGCGAIVFCLSDKKTLSLLQSLRGCGKKIIVVSALSPASLGEVSWTDGAVAVYGYAPASFTAAFAALAGDFTPSGVLPVGSLLAQIDGPAP